MTATRHNQATQLSLKMDRMRAQLRQLSDELDEIERRLRSVTTANGAGAPRRLAARKPARK
jgi:uncharacterized coiled-coil DUF342 family protein